MYENRETDGSGDLAHGVVAHIEVAETLALDQAHGEGGEEIVREGEPVCLCQCLVHGREEAVDGHTSQSQP